MTKPWSKISAEDFKVDPSFPDAGVEAKYIIENREIGLRYEHTSINQETVGAFKQVCSDFSSRRERVLSFCETMLEKYIDFGDEDIKEHLVLYEIYMSAITGFDGSKKIFEPIGSVHFRFSIDDLDDSFFENTDRFGPDAVVECSVPFSSTDSTWQWDKMYGDIVDFG